VKFLRKHVAACCRFLRRHRDAQRMRRNEKAKSILSWWCAAWPGCRWTWHSAEKVMTLYNKPTLA
jgi:hypothetical protein